MEAANLYTEAAGDAQSGTDADNYAAEFLATVDADTDVGALDIDSVVDDIPTDAASSDLTEALDSLASAETAKTDFLTGLDLDEDPATATTEADVATALSDAETARGAHKADLTGSEYKAEASSAFDGDSINVLNGKLTDAQTELADSKEAAAEETGLVGATATVTSAQVAYQEALEAEGKAETALGAEIAKADGLNGGSGTIALDGSISNDSANDLTALAEGVDVVTTGGNSLIVVGANGTLKAADGITTSDVEGFDDLLAAAQASYNAEASLAGKQGAFEAALSDVLDIENAGWNDVTIAADTNGTAKDEDGLYALADGTGYVVKAVDGSYWPANVTADASSIAWNTTTPGDEVVAGDVANGEVTELPLSVVQDATAPGVAYYTPADGKLAADFGTEAPLASAVVEDQNDITLLENVIAEREALIADVDEAQGLADDLEGLNQDISDAEDTLTDDESDGGFGVNLVDLGNTATSGDDLYVFSTGADTSTSQFGGAGEDKLYVGEDFTQVDLASDADFADEQGDAGTLEVFFQQNGADAVLTFENKAFGGNSAGTDDLTEVTLTGVNVDDLSFENGFITAGTAADIA